MRFCHLSGSDPGGNQHFERSQFRLDRTIGAAGRLTGKLRDPNLKINVVLPGFWPQAINILAKLPALCSDGSAFLLFHSQAQGSTMPPWLLENHAEDAYR